MSVVLDEARRAVLVDMAYEMGGRGIEGFVHLLAALREGNWEQAAIELGNSLLFSEVPHREAHNQDILRTGVLSSACPDTRSFVRLNEGLTLVAKPDAKGKWAIGWGHDIDPPASGRLFCTINEAEAWFSSDFILAVARARKAIGPESWPVDETF